jgi:hypothetical protein
MIVELLIKMDVLHIKVTVVYLFFFYWVRWDWVHLVRRPLLGPLYQLRIIDECGADGGMRIGRRKREYSEETCPSAT